MRDLSLTMHSRFQYPYLPIFCLILSITCHFLCTQHWFLFRPIFFAPFLTLSFYRFTREKIIVLAFFLGLFADLSSSYFFGVHTFLYVIVSFSLYKINLVFKEQWLILTCLNILFAVTFVIFSYPMLSLLHYNLSWNAASLFLDIKYIIRTDGLYSGAIYFLLYCVFPGLIKIKDFLRRASSCY